MMPPRLPGVWYARGRQTAFFHVPDGTSATSIFPNLFPAVQTRRATDGGVVENGCFLITPDGAEFQAITWWSKRPRAWRRDFAVVGHFETRFL